MVMFVKNYNTQEESTEISPFWPPTLDLQPSVGFPSPNLYRSATVPPIKPKYNIYKDRKSTSPASILLDFL